MCLSPLLQHDSQRAVSLQILGNCVNGVHEPCCNSKSMPVSYVVYALRSTDPFNAYNPEHSLPARSTGTDPKDGWSESATVTSIRFLARVFSWIRAFCASAEQLP